MPVVARGDVAPWPVLAAGVVLGLPQFTTYRVRWTRPVRFAIKVLGGAGLGLAVAGGLLLPWPLWAKGVAAVLVLLAFAGMQALRLRSVLATCRACPWRRDWSACPGFQGGGWREPPPGHVPPRVVWRARRPERPHHAESGK